MSVILGTTSKQYNVLRSLLLATRYCHSCLLHRLHILFPQSLFWDTVIDEIPGKDFIQIPLLVNIKVSVDIRLPKGLAPISVIAMCDHQYLPPPVSQ